MRSLTRAADFSRFHSRWLDVQGKQQQEMITEDLHCSVSNGLDNSSHPANKVKSVECNATATLTTHL